MNMNKLITFFIVMLLGLSIFPVISTSQSPENSVGDDRGARPATVSFTNVTAQANLSGVSGNSFSWGDYNNDGYEDLLVTGRRLFRNNGPPGWNFTEVTSQAGLTSGTSGGVWGDIDNDGDLDLFSVGRKSDTLYENNGDGTFTDITVSAGNVRDDFPTVAAGWGDYDRDGYIDLYLANGEDWIDPSYKHYPNFIFNNNGDGTFTNTTVSTGIDDTSSPKYSRGVNWGDYNNDGWLDIHVSNYRLLENYLWENDRDGTFTDVAGDKDVQGVWDPDRYYDAQAQATYGDGTWGPTYGHTIGSAWADYDNDGNLDMWTSNLVHKYVGPTSWPSMPYDIRGYVCDDSKMYYNWGAPYYNFSDARPTTNIPFKPIGGSGTYQGDELFDGVAWGDFDNDGDLDLWLPQVYDLNYAYSFLYEQDGVGSGQFTDRAGELGMKVYNTYAGCWSDYDNDGDLDLITAGKSPFVAEGSGKYEIHLYRNSGNSNNYLRVALNGTTANRFAIGARVKVTTGTTTMMREVEGGMGCNAHQNSMILHFGLGTASIVDEIEVWWPDGRLQFLDNVAVNQQLNLTEPSDPLPTVTNVQVNPSTPVEEQQVTFTATINAGGATVTNLKWDFEADNIFDLESTAYTAQHSYTNGGLKHTRLRVITDQDAGVDYYPIEVNVINLIPEPDLVCNLTYNEDEVATFNASASSDTPGDLAAGLEYYWKFGDGTELNWSANHTVTHSYTEEDVYTVNLSVKDIDGSIGYLEQIVTVQNVPPVIEFLPDIIEYEDIEVEFTANVTDTESDTDTLEYQWEYGDGEGTNKWSQTIETSHVYPDKGNYSAQLIARDDDLVESISFQNVTILNPIPQCTITTYDNALDEDEMTTFGGEGTDNPSDLSSLEYKWDFGDNNTIDWGASLMVSHSYEESGNYTVRLYVKDDDSDINYSEVLVTVKNIAPSCEIDNDDMTVDEDEMIEFNGTATDTDSDKSDLYFSWDFGDGNSSDWSTNPGADYAYIHQGEYDVVMYVKDNNDHIFASESIDVKVKNVDPEIKGAASTYEIDEGQELRFEVTKLEDTDSDLPFLWYEWDLDDGSDKVKDHTFNHTYYVADEYNVKLKVYDDDGSYTSHNLKTIVVNNIPPVASFRADKTDVGVDEEVAFTAMDSTDSPWETDSLRYMWKFGDGKSGNGVNVTYSYNEAGTYKVKLTVYDNDDAFATYTLTVNVTEPETKSSSDDGLGDVVIYAAIAGVAILVILLLIIFLLLKRKKRDGDEPVPSEGDDVPPAGDQPQLPPLPPPIFPPPPGGLKGGLPPLPFPPPAGMQPQVQAAPTEEKMVKDDAEEE
jgi:PKD repeat protein